MSYVNRNEIGTHKTKILGLICISCIVGVLLRVKHGFELALAAAIPCALTIRTSDPDYKDLTIVKIWLVLALAVSIIYKSALTPWLLAANIAGLALLPTRFRVPLVLVAVYAVVVDTLPLMYPWVYASVLSAFMLEQSQFREHLILNIWALYFPLLLARNNTSEWLRVRVLCLLCMLVYDRFDIKNSFL